MQGVPCEGVIDTGSDIMIMGGKLFKRIAAIARLRKRDFHPADKTSVAYGRQPFSLHGKMSLSISFGGREMVTPIYIKMDSEEPLLLAEGVCRQLQIVTYHPDVLLGSQAPVENTKPEASTTSDEVSQCHVTLVHTPSCHISQPMCQCRVTEPKVHCSSSLDLQRVISLLSMGFWSFSVSSFRADYYQHQ